MVPVSTSKELGGDKNNRCGAQKRSMRCQKQRAGQQTQLLSGESKMAGVSQKGTKRTRTTGSTPPSQRQVSKRANNVADGNANEEKVVVAVAPKQYPDTLLDVSQVKAIDREVMRLVMLQDPGFVPQFDGHRLVEGALHVTCQSSADRRWLEKNAVNLKPFEGADLVVKSLDQLPKRVKVKVFTKVGQNGPEILKALGAFNTGLRVESWRILDYKLDEDRDDSMVVVSIPEKEVRELQRLELRPRVGLGRAKCLVLARGGGRWGQR